MIDMSVTFDFNFECIILELFTWFIVINGRHECVEKSASKTDLGKSKTSKNIEKFLEMITQHSCVNQK